MGKLLQNALQKQKQFYIYELTKTGMFEFDSLNRWTVTELRREYERNRTRQKKKREGWK
ncbi:Fur-regulated basic protein FbpA [Anoxybacillus sp. J5B_2022]|uniref:Fur-regulated basic protein FbpA n=1 Tax=Anoxybacillus sp. J5B_2022 TaxID=3003246 RepID=UPI0022856851|nr:Fur-regulated basic protein FbpA [Anoxybacillus sp. J5B_2022]MCZ0755766.1 Fur-regulated basic protein FbpA [Anoxybacillus sp. J5B_2022]